MTEYFVHESAYIDEGAKIGKDTRIWHFSHIMPRAVIGESCSLAQNVFVSNHVVIGNHVKIQNNVSIYEGVILEDYVFCGPSMVFTNVKNPRSAFPRNPDGGYLKTIVKHGATLGANSTIVCGITVGRWSFIAAGSTVTKDVPDYALMLGVPARQQGWVCECGERLNFEDSQATCVCGRRYQALDNKRIEKV